MNATAAVVIQDVFKIYKEGDVETVALRGANLTVAPGEFVAIQGRSGSGKSTLLNLIGGLAIASAGRIIIDGTDFSRMNEGGRTAFRREHIGVVFQADNLIPFLSARENVALPMTLANRRNASAQAEALLREVGLLERIHHHPGQLSGGERQRVAIAVALANQPKVLLADELTGELDSVTADRVMELLATLNIQRDLTLIVVTHNASVAARAKRQVSICDGQLYDTVSNNQAVAHVN